MKLLVVVAHPDDETFGCGSVIAAANEGGHDVRDGHLRPGARLYYWCLARSVMQRWLAHNRGSVYDGASDDEVGCPDDQITTIVDVADLLPRRLEAIACHRSQVSPYGGLPGDLVDAFLATARLVRARPPWTGGPLESTLLTPPATSSPSPTGSPGPARRA